MISIPISLYIDRYAGKALCAVMDYYSRLRGLEREPIALEDVRNVLVVKFWGLGNLVEATPAFREIRTRFKNTRITFLTLERNRGLFDSYPRFDDILYMKDKTLAHVIWEFFALPRKLRKEKFDIVFDMDPIGRFCALITFMSGASIRVGYSTANQHRERLYTRRIRLDEDRHIRRIFLELLSCAGGEPEDDSLDRIPVSGAVKSEVDEIFGRNGIADGERVIGINVNASEVAFERRWPAKNFAGLADWIVRETGSKVVFFGAPGEADYVAGAVSMMSEGAANIAGKTTLSQMVEAISRCSLFITNDSGPLHVAVAMGVPTVSFFGPESPDRYGPIGESHTVLNAGVDCSPCISFKNEKQVNCRFYSKCMTDITIEMAIQAVADRLKISGQ